MIQIVRLGLVAIFCVLPLGCASLFDPGPPAANVIMPVQLPEPAQAERLPIQLLVSRPATEAAMSTDRIMALMNGYEVRALDEAKWASPVPLIVQRQLVDALESSRRLAAVGWEESSLDTKYRLSTDIRRFFLRYDSPGSNPTVDIALVFALIDTESGKILARRLVRVEEQCEGNTVRDFVTTFSLAMSKALAQTCVWTVEQLEPHVLEVSSRKDF